MFVSDPSLFYGGVGLLISFPRALIAVLLFAPVAMSGLKFSTKAILWVAGVLLIPGTSLPTIIGILLLVGVVSFSGIRNVIRARDKKREETKEGPA